MHADAFTPLQSGTARLPVIPLGGISNIEYSDQFGTTANIGLQGYLGDQANGLILGRFGEKQRGVEAGLAFSIDGSQRLTLMGEHLSQRYLFDAGQENYWAKQNKVGVVYSRLPAGSPVKKLDIKYAYTRSQDTTLADTSLTVDTPTLFQIYTINNSFVGARSQEATFDTTFDIGQHGELLLSAGASATRSNDGAEDHNRFSGGVKYRHYLGKARYALSHRAVVDRTETGLEYETALGGNGGTLRLSAMRINGNYGFTDTQGSLSLTLPIG